MSDAETAILFDGKRNFEASKTTAHVLIVEHLPTSCLEVIVYDKSEAPRVYLSSQMLYSKIDRTEVQKLTDRRRSLHRRSTVNDNPSHDETHSLRDIAVQYIFERMELRYAGKKCAAIFSALPTDTIVAGNLDVICQKPLQLKPATFVPRKTSES
jgi:hypothetical protein